jgi:hypothetical protein
VSEGKMEIVSWDILYYFFDSFLFQKIGVIGLKMRGYGLIVRCYGVRNFTTFA